MTRDVSPGMSTGSREGEPWGKRLWIALAAVMIIATWQESYGIRTWPMADDEVPSLVELGLLHIGAEAFFSVPPEQIGKLPKATPVWNGVQRFAISLLPASETSYRIPSLVFGILTSAIVFLVAARWRGLWYAAALAIVVQGSQLFIFLVQLNRFYSLALLLMTLALSAMWLPRYGSAMVVATAVLAALAVLSHNITVVVFVLAFLASCAAFVLGRVASYVVVRSGVAAAVSVLLYVLYLRPLVQGWSSTGNPTPIFISLAAHAGVPLLALALLGCVLAIHKRERRDSVAWWTLMFAGSLCVFVVASEFTNMNWNPRYFLFFLPAVWVLAAHAAEFIARQVGFRFLGAAWYGAVVVLFLPGLASHYQDGSRHDYRRAAAVIVANAGLSEPIFSDDAETITYYLPPDLRPRLEVRTRVRQIPRSAFFLVVRSTVWTPLPQVHGRRMELVAEIRKRRYDYFSHVLRVYRVAAEP